jgi:hypothetical protein
MSHYRRSIFVEHTLPLLRIVSFRVAQDKVSGSLHSASRPFGFAQGRSAFGRDDRGEGASLGIRSLGCRPR